MLVHIALRSRNCAIGRDLEGYTTANILCFTIYMKLFKMFVAGWHGYRTKIMRPDPPYSPIEGTVGDNAGTVLWVHQPVS